MITKGSKWSRQSGPVERRDCFLAQSARRSTLSVMRSTVLITSLGLLVLIANAADHYLSPGSHPVLRIKSTTTPVVNPKPLRIELQISAEGKGPVALSQDQFIITASVSPYVQIEPTFETTAPRIFTISPGKPITASLFLSTTSLKPGKYHLTVDTGSGKTRQFDYQYMGQTHSQNYEVEVR
jgi:hypothetical protein